MNQKSKSTYNELIDSMSEKEKQVYEAKLKNFLVSEIILSAIEQDTISVKKLAKLIGLR